MNHLLPPRKRNWRPGTPQVGVFVRTETGEQVAATADRATPPMELAAWWLLHMIACKGCPGCQRGRLLVAGRMETLRRYQDRQRRAKAQAAKAKKARPL